jgi:hypothetical protein
MTELSTGFLEGAMAQSLTNGFTGRQLELYTSEYYDRSDLVFRFGALMTVSRDGAERVTEEAFRFLVEDFSTFSAEPSAHKVLMTCALRAWKKLRQEKFHEWKSPILQSLKPLAEEPRLALFLVEIAGLQIDEAASLMGSDVTRFRTTLAAGQKFLATNMITV